MFIYKIVSKDLNAIIKEIKLKDVEIINQKEIELFTLGKFKNQKKKNLIIKKRF